jgi:hypothetical protein
MVTPDQIAVLRYMIYKSKDGNNLAKRILIYLLNASEGLTKQVCLCLVEGMTGYTRREIEAAADTMSAMDSGNCTTHLHMLTMLMGTEMHFSCHGGVPEGEKGFNYDGKGYTFFIGVKSYGNSGNGTELRVTKDDLDRIDIKAGMLFEDQCRQGEALRMG